MVAGYILAGGKNSRMACRKKAFLTLGRETFLERIQRAMQDLPIIYLSVECEAGYEGTGLPLIVDEIPQVGPLGGIYSGLSRCDAEALFVVACDMPYIDRRDVSRLLEVYERCHTLVVTRHQGRIHPLFGIYPRALLRQMERSLSSGDYKLGHFLETVPYAIYDLEGEGKSVRNINDADDYRALRMMDEENRAVFKQEVEIEEAINILIDAVEPVKEKCVLPLLQAGGYVLAEDLMAQHDQPPFSRSPLDGYALRGEDTADVSKERPGRFRIIGKIYAGEVFDGQVGRMEAVRIMTGAPIPQGANAVIRQEDIADSFLELPEICVSKPIRPYRNYCRQGEDYSAGEVLAEKGSMIDSGILGLAAALGRREIAVYTKPKIAVISTGSELLRQGAPWEPGKIYDYNLTYLCARLRELQIPETECMQVEDQAGILAEKIRGLAGRVQLILTTGGVSVGEKDILHDVIRELGAKRLFWRVNMKPGAPVMAAVYKHTLLLCLSGNPYGAAVGFELLARPVIARLAQNPKWNLKKKRAVMQDDYEKKAGCRRFLRGVLTGDQVSLTVGNQSSGACYASKGSNCLIEISPDMPGARKGTLVWVYLL